jgi:hypothetical protein
MNMCLENLISMQVFPHRIQYYLENRTYLFVTPLNKQNFKYKEFVR